MAKRRPALTVIHAPIRPVPDPWTPVTLLEEFVAKLKSGEIKCSKGLMVFFLEESENGRRRPHYWTTGLGEAEIIGFCEVAKAMAIEDWRGPSKAREPQEDT